MQKSPYNYSVSKSNKAKKYPFFSNRNKAIGITPSDYIELERLIDSFKYFEDSPYHGFFILDFFRQEVCYISRNWYQYSFSNEMNIPSALEQTFDHLFCNMSKQEEQTFNLACNEAFDFIHKYHPNHATNFSIIFEQNMGLGKVQTLVKHKIRPLLLDKDGKIWAAIVITSATSHAMSDLVTLRNTKTDDFYVYNINDGTWSNKTHHIKLSQTEKIILIYSARGMTLDEIAAATFRSIDCIKTIRKRIFKKFGVRNIGEAVLYAACNEMLQ